MKRLLVIFALLILITPGFAQYSFREVLFLPWGTGEHQIGLRQVPGDQFGPLSFAIRQDSLLLLDSQNKRLKIFRRDSLLVKVALPSQNVDDFVWKHTNHYFLLSDNALLELVNQQLKHTYRPASPRNIITSLNMVDKTGEVYAVLNNSGSARPVAGKPLAVGKAKAIVDNHGHLVKIIKQNWKTIIVNCNSNSTFKITSAKPDLAAAKFLGRTPGGDLYIYLETLVKQVPLQTAREIRRYTTDGSLKARFIVPTHAHTYIFKEFYIDARGNIFQMISAENGIYIVGWYLNEKAFQIIPCYRYPAKYSQFYHYNLLKAKEPQLQKTDTKKKRPELN